MTTTNCYFPSYTYYIASFNFGRLAPFYDIVRKIAILCAYQLFSG
nr:MAG TPA: hypothetical protein [Caudoviricetes sp.]